MTPRLGPAFAMLAVLIAAPLLAGCVGTAAATAMETRSAADAAAAAWEPDAQLAQVVGVEGTLDLASIAAAFSGASADYDRAEYDRASADESVGDGRAEVWGYRYIARGNDMAYVVVVDREGKIVQEGEEPRSSAFSTALGTWEIDSDRALAIAKEAQTALAKGVEGENFGFVSLLAREPDSANPSWIVIGGGGSLASGGGGGFVELDAITGKVLRSEGGYMTPEDWMGAYRSGRGS